MAEDLLIEKKIELLVGMQTKKLQEQIGDLKRVIVALNEEVVSIKGQIKENAVAKQHSVVKNEELEKELAEQKKEEPVVVQTAPTEQKQETINVVKEDPNPRSGEFDSNDVSIEKIFYMGNK